MYELSSKAVIAIENRANLLVTVFDFTHETEIGA